jgi:hypothetical protein
VKELFAHVPEELRLEKITARIGKLNNLLATRTEKSALALRRLTGAITYPRKSRSRPALLHGPVQIRRPQPAGRGRRFELYRTVDERVHETGSIPGAVRLARIEAPGRAAGAQMKSIPGEWCRGPKGPKHGGGAGNRIA